VSKSEPAVVTVIGRPVPVTIHHIVEPARLNVLGFMLRTQALWLASPALVSVSPGWTSASTLLTVASVVPRGRGLASAKSSLSADADAAGIRRSSVQSAAQARRPCIVLGSRGCGDGYASRGLSGMPDAWNGFLEL
jgi:hypothetical protein